MNNLTEEQKHEAERMFRLRRRIFDDANIKDNFDNCKEYEFVWIAYEDVDFTGLSDQDIFALVVILYDKMNYGAPSRAFTNALGWSKYKVYKFAKNEKFIYSAPLFREDDGLLAGKGYLIEHSIVREMNRLYDEFLWHDVSETPPERKLFLLDVDITDIYTGKSKGVIHKDGGFQLLRPEYTRFRDIPNWPKADYGRCDFPRDIIDVDKQHVKRWKILY